MKATKGLRMSKDYYNVAGPSAGQHVEEVGGCGLLLKSFAENLSFEKACSIFLKKGVLAGYLNLTICL